MKKEELEALKLTEEQIKEVFKLNGIDVESAKGDLKTKETELTTVKEQLKTANKEIETYKSMDIDTIKKSADEYKTKFEEAETMAKENLKKVQLDYKLETLLLKEGAVNTKAVKALLDASKISLDGENLVGVDDQLKAIKESEKWAFGAQQVVRTGQQHQASFEGLSPVEQRFYEKNPDLKPE